MSVLQDQRLTGLCERILQKVTEILQRMLAHDALDDSRLLAFDVRLRELRRRQPWALLAALALGALIGFFGWGLHR